MKTYRVVQLSRSERRTIQDVIHLAKIGVDAETGERRASLLRGIATDTGTPLTRRRLEEAYTVLCDMEAIVLRQSAPEGWPAPVNEAEVGIRAALVAERRAQQPAVKAARALLGCAYTTAEAPPPEDED